MDYDVAFWLEKIKAKSDFTAKLPGLCFFNIGFYRNYSKIIVSATSRRRQ